MAPFSRTNLLPKKLKVGDKVVVKLAPTNIDYPRLYKPYSKVKWFKGVVDHMDTDGCVIVELDKPPKGFSTVIIDNTGVNTWHGIVVRSVAHDS